MPKIVPKSIQTCFEHVLGQTFRKFFAQFSMEGRVFQNFRKNQKIFKISKTFKITKMPKIVPKSIQTYFERLLGQIFRTVFAQFSTEGRLLENFQKKIKKFSKFQKCPKSFPKVSKRVLNKFWGNLFENFLPSFPWKVESSKIFKKLKKNSKLQKRPKSFPKVSKRVLNVFWGKLFEKFLPSFPWKVESSKIFEKIKNFSNFQKLSKYQKCPKSFPKVSKRILNVFWGKFFEQFLPSFPRRVDS